MPELKPGDIVVLKSGGPNMTVEAAPYRAANGDTTVRCIWFDNNAKQAATFSPESLKVL